MTLEKLLEGIRGVPDIPESTRKSVHTHSDVYRGAVRQEQSFTRKLNGLLKAVRAGKISKETALKTMGEYADKHFAVLDDIALRHAKRQLKKDVSVLPPEVVERHRKSREETLKSFSDILADLN